jgi:protein O-mannosyl-transferase
VSDIPQTAGPPLDPVKTRSTTSVTLPEKHGTRWNASLPGSGPRGWVVRLQSPPALALVLFLMTLGVFWPAVSHPFMGIDDGEYVTEHPFVRQGLTWTGVGVALTARHSGNWHPLTTVSHMLDCQMFGLEPAGHHFVNILLHALNAALVFWVLRTMTGSRWRSFLVAALFALHPLRVESVAWVSERKDVLSVFFCLLSLWAYARFTEFKVQGSGFKVQSSKWYGFALLFFALGLMSKPMLVTLPFVLILLDYWPLGRLQLNTKHSKLKTLVPLLREKIPFFVLCLLVSHITSQVQREAMAELKALPLSIRVENMFLSYGQYLAQTVCPANLAVVYPYNPKPPVVEIAIAVALAVAVSVLAWRWRERLPWFPVGWLWFLGTLIPVIGIVQVGIQSRADRYTYLPSIGLWVLVVWTAARFAGVGAPAGSRPPTATTAGPGGPGDLWVGDGESQRSNAAVPVGFARILLYLAGAALLLFVILTRVQLSHWEDTGKLMLHTERVAGPSELMRGALGGYYFSKGKLKEAAEQYRLGLRTAGDAWSYVVGLANVYAAQGKVAEAERLYRRALAAKTDPGRYLVLADFLQNQNRLDEARSQYLQGLALAPYHYTARNQLGNVYAKQQNWPAAREEYERALRLNPKSPGLHFNLANVLVFQGHNAGAVEHFTRALQLNANALKANPANAKAHFGLAGVYAKLGQPAQVVYHLREAIRLDPSDGEALNNLAWLLATSPDATLRNGAEAVHLAARAVKLTRTNDSEILETLAAAHAEAGQFPEAVSVGRQALELAISAGQTNQLTAVSNRLELYQKRLPYRAP